MASMGRSASRRYCDHSTMSIFTEELFGTDNDADNRAAVAAVPAGSLRLAGLALHDQRRIVDKVLRGLPLHP